MARRYTKRYADGHQKQSGTHLGPLVILPQGVIHQRPTAVHVKPQHPAPLPSHKARVRQAIRLVEGQAGFVSLLMQTVTRRAAERLVERRKSRFVILPKRPQ